MLRLTFDDGSARRHRTVGRPVNVWYNERGVCCARAFVDGAARRIDWEGLGAFEFNSHSLDVRVVPQPDVHRDVIVDTFERLVQPVILQSLGWPVLHASAVTLPAGVLAFCARSGSGKSTFAAAMSRRGFAQFSDDALVLQLAAGSVRAHALPFATRLRPASAAFFEGTGIGPPPPLVGAGTRTPLAAIVLLDRLAEKDASTSVDRVNAHRAFSAVLTHAHCFDLADQPAVEKLVADYLDVTRLVPVFACRYQPGWTHFPDALDQIVTAVSDVTAVGST
jgi:hypothetical protein